MSAGRTIRLDAAIRNAPVIRWGLLAPIFVLFVVLTIMMAVLPSETSSLPDDSSNFQVWLTLGGVLLAIGVGIEIFFRVQEAFELQLLPGGVRMKSWFRREVLLIEPEIIGGHIRWTDCIRLRTGQQQITIDLNWFQRAEARAAIIEHCSQFLSIEQQAQYGRDWAKRYYDLITPRKPMSCRDLLYFIGIITALGTLAIVVFVEASIALGIESHIHGSPRTAYVFWLAGYGPIGLGALLLAGVLRILEQKEKRQLLISKTASTSTAAPVGNAANPSAERA